MDSTDGKYLEILHQVTPEQKVATLHALRQTAWDLKVAWLRQTEPSLKEEEIQARVRRLFLYAST